MRKLILASGLLLAFGASPVMAEGLNLRWQACDGDGGTQNRAFACDTNTGSHVLAASFTLDSDMNDVIANELVLDYRTSTPTLAPWWELRSNPFQGFTACRNGAISILAQDGASCPDLFGVEAPAASMNIAALQPFLQGQPNAARLLSVNAIPSTSPVQLILADNPAGNATWGVAKWTINNIKTVGSDACTSCLASACLVFTSCNIVVLGNTNNRRLTNEASPGSSIVTWQGEGANCLGTVPTHKSTWSRVKSLYR